MHPIHLIREKRDQPFFVYLPANLIHVPLQVPDELKAPFDGLPVSEPTKKIYGISADPGETTDLAGEHPEIVGGMTKKYDQWLTDVTRRCSDEPERSE